MTDDEIDMLQEAGVSASDRSTALALLCDLVKIERLQQQEQVANARRDALQEALACVVADGNPALAREKITALIDQAPSTKEGTSV